MADLSDADWKTLLGDDYKTKMMERDAAAGVTDESRAATSKANLLSNTMWTSLAVAFLGLIIFVTNYYSVSGPFSSTLSTFSLIVTLVSLAIAAYAWRSSAA